jgi:hypothetical protein
MATKRSSARHHPIRCDGRSNTAPKRLRANRSGGSNGPDLDYYNIGPRLRGRFRLSAVGYGGGIGIGGIPLIVLIVYLLLERGGLIFLALRGRIRP